VLFNLMKTKNSREFSTNLEVISSKTGNWEAYHKGWERIFGKKVKNVYLAGAIEYAPDKGQQWRAELTPFLVEHGYNVIDPSITEATLRSDYRDLKVTDIDTYRQITQDEIIWPDLKRIDSCKDTDGFLIVHWDEYVRIGGGTHGEITYSFAKGIPIYLVESLPREQISGWILGCTTKVFNNFEELKSFIESWTK